MKNKLILLFIAIALIILVIPANGFVFARLETAEDTTTTVDDSVVGKIVKLTDYQITNKGFYMYATATETSMTGGVIIRTNNFNAIPTYFLVQDVVLYSYTDTLYYKVTTVDGSTNTRLASTPWIESLCLEVVGDAPKTVVGATVSFKVATTVFYETISDDGTLGEKLFFASLPDEVVIIAIKEVNGVKYYQVALSDGSSDQNFDKLPWVKANDVNIVGFPEEEGVIEGQVSLTQSNEPSTTVSIVEGEKEHIFTQLSVAVGDTASYQWQMKVADNGWALINGYVSPYAVISHALIQNALDGDGYAYVRCIVKDGDKTFVSSQLAITMQSNVAFLSLSTTSDLSLSTTSDNQLAEETCNKNVGLLADGNAFHIRIIYEFLHAENDEISGSAAANILVITLGSGMYFDETITSPSVVGYKPYVECDASTSGRIEYAGRYFIPADTYKFTNQSTAIEVYIYYIPQEVSFRVKYFRQNLQDDEYTEYKTEFKSGTADTPVGTGLDVAMEGFSALYYDQTTNISSDGNTVVEVYYDRIYYLVKYVLGDGGYGVMPNYVRYGTNVMLGTPSKPGYEFNGWNLTSVKNSTALDAEELLDNSNNSSDLNSIIQGYKNATSANSQITVAHNLVYEAVWTELSVNYTIIYWRENENDDKFSIWKTETINGAVHGQVIDVSEKRISTTLATTTDGVDESQYFTYNEFLSDKTVTVKGDGTSAANIYYTRNVYHIVFRAKNNQQGATTCRIEEHEHDSSCTDVTCSLEVHTHTKDCGIASMTCTKEEHKHIKDLIANGGCLSCTIPEHTAHTASCITCGKEEHATHTVACYDGATSTTPGGYIRIYGNEVEGYIGRSGNYPWYRYWIYINGTWYEYEGDSNYKSTVEPSCGKELHSHSDTCYDCTIHIHNASCYGCGKEAHAHSSSCYTYSCGKTEHAHDAACVRTCQVYEHTHDANCTRNLYVLSAKYNADIAEFWPTEEQVSQWRAAGWLSNNVYYSEWNPTTGGQWATKRVDMTTDLCSTANNKTLTLELASTIKPGGNTVKYMFESVDQSNPGPGAVIYGGVYYEENTRYTQGYMVADSFSPKEILGMTSVNSNSLTLYYKRNSYNLVFVNGGSTEKTISVKYEVPLASQNYTPNTPSNYEKNSVYFAGWYTTQICADGTEFDFENAGTMPARELYLYAKWVPTTWEVNVYLDEAKTIELYSNDKVEFGSMIAEPDYATEQAKHNAYKELVFAGWYYTEEGEDVRFDFNTMAIKRNYEIFAKWTSHIPVEYTVRYVVEQTDGTYLDIAEPTTGVSLAGVTKTFTAKVGLDIDVEYRDYLPVERSQSKEMTVDGNNEVIFEYETAQNIKYTIKHTFTSDKFTSLIGKNTYEISWTYPVSVPNKAEFDGKIIVMFNVDLYDNFNADANLNEDIREDVWEVITSLSPDAYQKEIILVLDNASNVIEFTWADSGIIFVYQVIHYYQNVDGNKYTARRYEENFGKYDETTGKATITAVAQTEVGFEFNAGHEDSLLTTEVDRTQPLQSRVLSVYYDRVSLSYTVRHVYGTEVVDVPASEKVLYEEVVSVNAVPKTGYVVAGQETQSVSITYDGQIIVFNYVVQEVIYNYQVADGVGGSVSRVQETVSVVALQNQVKGSVPIPSRGYVFVGWYLDESCTISVDPAWIVSIDGNANGLKPTPQTAYANTTKYFYAKFEPTVLVIQNAGAGVADDQVFVYDVTYTYKDTENNDVSVSMQVTVIGKGKVTIHCIPAGAIVTIAVVDSWSWRYNPDNSQKIATIPNDKTGVTVTFTYTKSNDKWLSDSDYVVNLGEE